jgi:hypothetical protein
MARVHGQSPDGEDLILHTFHLETKLQYLGFTRKMRSFWLRFFLFNILG